MLPHRKLAGITQKNVQTIAKLEAAFTRSRTFGERMADIAVVGIGSWKFLIFQSILMIGRTYVTMVGWWNHWDPYPFILLKLALSCEAAFATPLILMSQNRQARLSERRNQLDLQINILAEQEITEQLKLLHLLCEKAGIQLKDTGDRTLEQRLKPESIVEQLERTDVSDIDQ